MHDKKLVFFPLIFTVALVPALIMAVFVYQPGKSSGSCPGTAHPAAVTSHVHGVNVATTVKGDMQLILNVGPAVDLYQVVNGTLQVCSPPPGSSQLKHIAVNVLNARLATGEPLPVSVDLTLQQHDNGNIVVQAGAPAIYAPGYGYYFGDNFRLASGLTYDWTIVVSPVKALRMEGSQDAWLDPVQWSGSFTLDAQGEVVTPGSRLRPIGTAVLGGLQIEISYQDAQPLYAVDQNGTTQRQEFPAGSHYFAIVLIDQSTGTGDKLPGADVSATFTQGTATQTVPFEAAISPVYGFHYGANVVLAPGDWQVTVRVGSLNFLRHASSAVNLPQQPASATFNFTLSP